MNTLRTVYLALTILGAAVPVFFMVIWLQNNGWSASGLVDLWTSNAAFQAVLAVIVISAIALSVFILAELPVRKDSLCLIAIPVTFCIGIACGLPLYLFLRSRNIN